VDRTDQHRRQRAQPRAAGRRAPSRRRRPRRSPTSSAPDGTPIVCELKARASGQGFATLERWLGDARLLLDLPLLTI
jgi:hypothetical protein